ncbi:alpha/beta hydrolase [Ruegeria sediminis]|uniref:Alpha/beta hydrolase n=1 Tax=Ruegeria sediminis TaxID=2583820 RepID=A0ABY2X3B0_9RHOB|nr:alpha/beta fold hydrolase [Ruegeria sediminis]TMV09583.1 alpha/beta hydrolase [Ruegeria sediminis]
MRAFGRVLGRILLVLVIGAGLLWWFGPYEEVDLNPTFEPRRFGEGVQVYFESIESRFDDIVPGVEKRVIWQPGAKEQRTPYSVLYLHGFSATSEEIRPVPDRVAEALGANLVFTRLQGHGRGGAAMAEGTASGWMRDTAEGLAAARAVGERVVVIATSTGATLAAAAALDPDLAENVAAVVLVSPNFGVNARGAWLPTLPGARYWLPLVMGDERDVSGADPAKDTYWTSRYPWEAIVPMSALVRAVMRLDFSEARVPVLFWFSEEDQVVRPDRTHRVAEEWGGPAAVRLVTMGPMDDPSAHVVAGDIYSPGQTDAAVSGILAWLKEQGIE